MAIGKGVIKIVAICAAALVLITIVVVSYLSGEIVSIETSLQALGLFLAGLLTAIGFRRSGTLILILAVCGSLTACAGQPWLVARGTIGAAQGALEAVEGDIPVEGSDAMELTRSALAMGELAVDMWEQSAESEAPIGWWKWAGSAARGFALVLDVLKRVGVPIPTPLAMAAAAISAMVVT